MNRYEGKTAVVTGGSSGIGLAVATLLARGGARVAVTGRSASKLDAVRDRLGGNGLAVRGDVASAPDLDTLADRVRSAFGRVDALFVNAGVAALTPFATTTEQRFDEIFATNVKGAFFTVQKLAPLLGENAGVVLTTSVADTVGILDSSVYAASKAALRSLARSLSRELLPRGIRVNAISPGPVDTGVLETTMSRDEAERFVAQRVAENPMRRFGTPEEVAVAAAFLAFDATYTAGVELAVDGGATQL